MLKTVVLTFDLLVRIGLGIALVVYWIQGQIDKAAFMALVAILFVLHDIWREVRK